MQKPTPFGSVYRIASVTNLTSVVNQWTVYELGFFTDAECLEKSLQGVAVSSRAKYVAPASRAFDRDTNTAFEADCEFDTWTVCETSYADNEETRQAAGRRCFERKACRAGTVWLGWDMSYHAGR